MLLDNDQCLFIQIQTLNTKTYYKITYEQLIYCEAYAKADAFFLPVCPHAAIVGAMEQQQLGGKLPPMESHKLSNCQIKMHSLKKSDLTITKISAR